jgi:uncharacterized caspase-like protein
MSENTSLTDAVKLTAGISLTKAVKDAAGRRVWFVDDVLDFQIEAARCAVARRVRRLHAACAKLAAFAVVTLSFLISTSTNVLNVERASLAATHRRVALVVGNSAYQNTPSLTNPRNDAADMIAVLKSLGFRVIEGIDLNKEAFDAILREFAVALKGAEVGLFFYAGHGIQVSGHNYLVPVDAQLTTVSAVDIEMVRLDFVQDMMEQEAQTNLLFFDACRDNPLTGNLARAMGSRSPEIGRGLAPVRSSAGTLISFSTQPGNVAFDGSGRNSPFSAALVRQLATSNEDLNAMLIAVRIDVIRHTDRKQVPWEHSALTRRLYLNPAVQSAALASTIESRSSEAADAWDATRDTDSLAVLDAFLARYGDTFFAVLARTRMGELRKAMTPSPHAGSEAGPASTSAR